MDTPYNERKFIMNKLVILLASVLLSSTLQARDIINIVGSSTVYPYSTVVAERLSEAGSKAPTVASTGSGGGMKMFCAGVGLEHPDITNASRAMKSKEAKLCLDNGVDSVVEVIVGNDGIVFANSLAGPDMKVTTKQLWLAMAKEVPVDGKLVPNPYTKWSEIDASLPNMKIDILVAPPSSGTRDAWESLVMKKGCKEAGAKDLQTEKNGCKHFREDGATTEMGENDTLIVNKLKDSPDRFGFFGYSYLLENKDAIKGSTVNGVKPSLETIQSYEYPIARPLFYYIKKDHVGIVPGIEEYAKLFISEEATSIDGFLGSLGLVPLAEDKAAEVKAIIENLTTMDLKAKASK